MKRQLVSVALVGLMVVAGCESLPGEEQGVVTGGVLGAGGGYLIGARGDKRDREEARQAGEHARGNPATPAQAKQSATADLNKDGFVTLDEVVAMKEAGIADEEMVKRLRATDQVFQLTSTQEQYLRDHGVAEGVVRRMGELDGGSETVSKEKM